MPADEIVAVGGDLDPMGLLGAYREGVFPMPIDDGRGRNRLCWWSPEPRGVIIVDGHRGSRSLRRARRAYDIRVDTAFERVVDACADPTRPHGWITPEIRAAYVALHRLGHAHSVEAWHDNELAGGLYGVAVGGLFAGESMYHHRRDASKAAVAGLVEILLTAGPGRLIDVQWLTPHLATLGATAVSRATYRRLLAAAVDLDDVAWPGPPRE